MLGLGKAMARELGAFGIRINSVTPGLIATDITAGKLDDQMKAKILEGIALARMGTPEDVAKAFLFLASDLSSYITGATLDVNGGMHIH
jgi:NAD(P)-dependent dehydrogenase (short-subunit alcohol dehydrogenase family)